MTSANGLIAYSLPPPWPGQCLTLRNSCPSDTTFWLKVWNGLAFLATALALDRLVGPDRGRRVRAHLLWSLNPLMLWAGLAGGHADILGVAFVIVSLSLLRR
jgi:hypothetical protein